MSKHRKKKHTGETVAPSQQPRMICGWCGQPIRPGNESDNLYEPDIRYADLIPHALAHVHKSHVPEEDHPLYDQMPHIVFTGLPPELEDAR